MTTHIDNFQCQIASYFRELILAIAYLDIGSSNLASASKDASVALTLAHDLTTEPMYLRELLPHSAAVAHGIAELFQTKTIAAWADLLNSLFAYFVTAHLEGQKRIPELKTRSVRIDFSSEIDITSQLREGLIADFAFQQYAEKVKIINCILNPDGRCEDELSIIRKHVLIRNSIQHHGGTVYEDMLKKLGNQHLVIFDHEGNSIKRQVEEPIALFIPELDHLKGALFRLTNNWRARFA